MPALDVGATLHSRAPDRRPEAPPGRARERRDRAEIGVCASPHAREEVRPHEPSTMRRPVRTACGGLYNKVTRSRGRARPTGRARWPTRPSPTHCTAPRRPQSAPGRRRHPHDISQARRHSCLFGGHLFEGHITPAQAPVVVREQVAQAEALFGELRLRPHEEQVTIVTLGSGSGLGSGPGLGLGSESGLGLGFGSGSG